MRLRISDADAARLGVEAEMPLSMVDIPTRDLFWLADRFDFEPEDWPTPIIGEVAFEDAGNPDAKPKVPRWQRTGFAWIALNQAGRPTTWEEAETLAYFRIQLVPEARDVESGKDQPAEDSTTPPSESSSD